ncbi:MAG: cation diffusion facilitator family transporter [Eubacterium sp.]|nr:cation diffusion facilitator family transporter [Eubacterium sp.]
MQEKKLKIEKLAMRISFIGTVAFAAAEFLIFLIAGSRAVLMDFVFDFVDVILIGPLMVLIPFLYKPASERHPYGYGQVESLFIIMKYLALVIVDIDLLYDNIRTIIGGGQMIDAGAVFLYEMISSIGTLAMCLVLKHLSRKYESMIIEAEIYSWKIYVYTSAGLALAFLLTIFLKKTPYAFVTPYMDPVIASVMAIVLIIRPIREIAANTRNLLLFSAPPETVEEVRAVAEEELRKYSCDINFLEVIQTGRKTWVEIYIDSESDIVVLRHLHLVRDAIRERLKDKFDQYYVELIPDIPN